MPNNNKPIQRNFIIGSEWLYYKIYTGHKTSDSILNETIYPIVEQLLEDNIIDKWFFIRYGDPKFHIRVRFHYTNPGNVGEIINRLNVHFQHYVAEDLVWKIQIDTYQREMERYGANTIDLAEDIFFFDSRMVTGFLRLIEGDEGEEFRWLFSLRAIDSFLNSFKYKSSDKLALLEILKTDFGEEFGMTKQYKKQLDKKYRDERKKIEEFMVFTADEKPEQSPILEVLKTKEEAIEDAVKKILEHDNNNTLQVNLNGLLASYIHMIMNRIFRSKNRQHEMICYDFLWRYYKSLVGRERKMNK